MTTNTLAANGTDIATLTESGAAPKTRVSSAAAIRSVWQRVFRDNDMRSKRNALVKGLVDGNPPYVQADLDKKGQKFRANFNNGEAESYLAVAQSAFYDLFSEVETYATVTVDMEMDMAVEWGDTITKHFDWLQRQDARMDYEIQLAQHDMVLYGSGPHVWEDDLDWRSRAIRHQHFYLPRNAGSVVEDWPWFILYHEKPVDELYRYIADEDAAKRRGWNPAAVKQAILYAGRGSSAVAEYDKWEAWQQAFRNNDLATGEATQKVRCVQMFWREFSKNGKAGTVSEGWIVTDNELESEFLFRKENRYASMRQAVVPFFYDRGDGQAHSVKGLGAKMYRMLVAKMRLQNAAVDNAFARAAIMVKAVGGGQNQATLAPTHLGPYTILPGGFEMVAQPPPQGLIDAPLIVGRDLDNTLAANLSQYRQRLDKPEGNPRTAFEIAQNAQQASTLGKTQIARYFEQLDDWYEERFRRATRQDLPSTLKHDGVALAREFQRRCALDGVPAWVYARCRVRAARTVGQGSHFVRITMLQGLLQTVFHLLPEDGKARLVRDLIAAQAGRDMPGRYMPQPIKRSGEANQAWEAQMENGILKDGGAISVTPTQNDVIHLQEHLNFASQASQALQQGANPADILTALDGIGKHAAMHLQRLAGNPMRQEEFKVLNAEFDELGKIAEQLQGVLQKQQEQAAQQQIQAQQAQQSMDIDRVQAQHKMALDREKAANMAGIKQAKARQDMALKDARTAQDMRQSSAQAMQQAVETATE